MGFPKKISQLPAAGTLKNSDIFILVNEHDVTSQSTLGEIASLVSGDSSTFTGNTSATCINQLWVHSISGCSPIQMGEVVMNQDVTFNGNLYLSPTSNTDVDFENANSVSIPTYVLKNCKGVKSDIVTFQNFADYVGKIVTLATEEAGLRWEVTLQPTLEVTSSRDCCFDNYTLTNCVTSEVYGIVNYEKWNGGSWVGTIIKIENDGGEFCYGVTTTCDAYDIDEKIEVVSEYETCAACTATTYSLIPCEGWEAEIINTITDLSDYVGTPSSIKETETGICYTVMGCFAECEPAPPITYEGFAECIDCLDNHILTNCASGAYIGTTTTSSGWGEPGTVYTASNVSECFTEEAVKQAADISSIENIGVMENCESWPCTNFILFDCDGEPLGISSQNLSSFDGLVLSGSNTTHSFSGQCFSIEAFPEDADLEPLDTSDWIEVDCEECTPDPPVEELSLKLIQEPGSPDTWTVTLTSNIEETDIGGFQLTIGDEGIEFEGGERGEIVPPSWEFLVEGNTNLCFNFGGESFMINEESIIATWILNSEDIITSLSTAQITNVSGVVYSVGVTII